MAKQYSTNAVMNRSKPKKPQSIMDRWIALAERRYGIPEDIMRGLIKVESGGDPNAESSAGAQGLTQFMPGTAKGYGVQFGDSPEAIKSQILGAGKYLRDLGFAKDPRRALMSYNAGPGNWQAAGDYADKVFGAAGAKLPSISGGGESTTTVAPTGPVSTGSAASPPDDRRARVLAMLASMNPQGSQSRQNYNFLSALAQPEPTAQISSGPGSVPEVSTGPGVPPPSGGNLSAFQMKQALLKNFPGLSTSSSSRPGAITQSGNPSLHGARDSSGHTRAFDLSGDPQVMEAAAQYAYKNFGPSAEEIFYDPIGYYYKKGKKIKGSIGGHSDHFHIGA